MNIRQHNIHTNNCTILVMGIGRGMQKEHLPHHFMLEGSGIALPIRRHHAIEQQQMHITGTNWHITSGVEAVSKRLCSKDA